MAGFEGKDVSIKLKRELGIFQGKEDKNFASFWFCNFDCKQLLSNLYCGSLDASKWNLVLVVRRASPPFDLETHIPSAINNLTSHFRKNRPCHA